MLITNFSAGELSETLYGRTDLPQYYRGASKLENFDVIPTGGIKNRTGTKRIIDGFKDGDEILAPSRIVPFVLSRDEAYLVVFCHEKIAVYRTGEWDAPQKVFTNGDISSDYSPQTLYTTEEIPAVQHAQNGRMMVMAQKNHPPLQIEFFPEDVLISVFYIGYMVQQVKSSNILSLFPIKNDETYEREGTNENIYLKTPGQYPGCVTFLNGRIVFASTGMRGQRLFFSRVGDINDFSTYKSYITEKKEYITVRGRIVHGSNVIELDDEKEAEKFTARPEKYIVDSGFFDAGTRLLSGPEPVGGSFCSLAGDGINIRVNSPAKFAGHGLGANEINEIKAALETREADYFRLNSIQPINNGPKGDVRAIATFQALVVEDYYITTLYVFIRLGVSKAVMAVGLLTGQTLTIMSRGAEFAIDSNTAGKPNIDAYLSDIIETQANKIRLATPGNISSGLDAGNTIAGAVAAWKSDIQTYMSFQHTGLNNGNPYYNYMPEIRTQVESSFGGNEVYIPLYTAEQIKDDYPTADDGFTFEIASDRNDEIRWMVQNKNLIVGTESAEYVIPANITAVNISAFLNSFYGSSKMQASSAGDAVLFFRDGQKGLVEYYVPQADNYFRTNDLLMMAPQMLSESEAVDFDVVAMPFTKLVITRADGKLVTLLYDRSLGVFAWGRVTLGSGGARSLAVVPGKSGYDDVYLLVEKDGSFCLELFENGGRAYLDSYKQWDGNREGYTDEAVIYGREENKVYPLTGELPEASENRFIGYPYASRIKSMPVLSNNQMKPVIIKNLLARFIESYEPKLISYSGAGGSGYESVFFFEKAPFTGVWKIMFPGSWDRDVMFEFVHEKPNKCVILAVNTEVN